MAAMVIIQDIYTPGLQLGIISVVIRQKNVIATVNTPYSNKYTGFIFLLHQSEILPAIGDTSIAPIAAALPIAPTY